MYDQLDFGGLEAPCLLPPHANPTSAVVLLHGYGATGDELIELGRAWQPALPTTAFIAPHAPEPFPDPHFDARQWFPLRDRDPVEYARGVAAAAPRLDHCLDAVLARFSLASDRLALVGFSQGCMMALHAGPRRKARLAAVLGYSGALAAPDRLAAEMATNPPVMLVHGEDDAVVPVAQLDLAQRALAAAGVEVVAHRLAGVGHTISNDGVALGRTFLLQRLPPAG